MKLDTRKIRAFKKKSSNKAMQMLTCYDYQMAELLNETEIDMLLVGDSVGNVVLGYDHTIQVELDTMVIFSEAVKRGAPDKFVVADLPFGSYATMEMGLQNSIKLFQKSKVEALKLEGAFPFICELIERLTQIGIPVMGHIGLTPQSVHEQGGYYTHGKDSASQARLIKESLALEAAGCFSIVLEFVEENLAKEITEKLKIPTIGIGSGKDCDGQVLVINDLLHNGKKDPPKFCKPIGNVYEFKKKLLTEYLK
ncbi:MAG: 3-methyl-2-oxobutanoate hydroxymethyltransferase [Bdellovibrionales bacterium]|nr:3-methyl-2-oxobutanoate hydroxymethyltransferase [Bdellovibrionales bacterium]